MAKRKKTRRGRHNFLFKVTNGDGSEKVVKVGAKVVMASAPVTLTVTEDHVRQAMRRHGVGHTSKCTMAVCCYGHKDAFPHMIEGHVDWNYSRAFVVTKVNKFGLPVECVAYEHDSNIARMNDTKGGLRKLLAKIQEQGPLTVQLRPYRKRSAPMRKSGSDRRATSGVRDPIRRRGANLRFDVAHLGAEPE